MVNTATISEYTVVGMSCQHCVAAITQEVGSLVGVNEVRVDLTTGQVRVTSGAALDAAVVRAAIEEAGYEVVG